MKRYTPSKRPRVRTHKWPQEGWVIGPEVSQWSENAVTALVIVVAIVGMLAFAHFMFNAWDRQIALDDAKNAQQWSDFYAAQEER